jgi:hypothetical protein
MAKGMEMMLKSLGLDPTVIMGRVQEFQKGITDLLTNINTRLEGIEKQQAEIRASQTETLKLIQELTAWKRITVQEWLQNQQQPPQVPPSQPQPPQPLPPLNLQPPPGPPNGQQNPPPMLSL